MVIHSIVDPLEIMERRDEPGVWAQVPGGFLQGVPAENGLTVTRLVSTDPAMYLNPLYQPGTLHREAPGK
ncbi:MAG: YlzJ-like family protein [Oscillospiraceae bacterium]|nr:YlzJ-like family protein [Oscillospiraceae bacterium]